MGSLLENEQSEDTVILHDEGPFSGEGLTNEEGKIMFRLKNRWGACSQHECMYFQNQSSAQVQLHRVQAALLVFGKKGRIRYEKEHPQKQKRHGRSVT